VKRQGDLAILLGEVVVGETEVVFEPFEERGLEDAAVSIEGVTGEPDEFGFVIAEFSGVLELVAKFFDLDYIGEANFAGAICEGEGGGGSRELLPDELQHEQLVEIVVQQRARDGIEFPVVVVGAAGQVDDHGGLYFTLLGDIGSKTVFRVTTSDVLRKIGSSVGYDGVVNFKFPKQQRLRQDSERGCSVPVFANLASVSEGEVLRDLPAAALGAVSVSEWIKWLENKRFDVLSRDGCPADIVPCAHLVALHDPRDAGDFHWIYRDSDGDVHDPFGDFGTIAADDPIMKNLSLYRRKVLTLSISRPLSRLLDKRARYNTL